MPQFSSDGVKIQYNDEGEGFPILLIHGFASNAFTNWGFTGWIKTLREAGYRVISLDNRGHGGSEKLYDPSAYEAPIMAEDARRLLDHLEIEQAAIMGYSMGMRICAFLALNHPQRVSCAILAGMGMALINGVPNTPHVVEGLLAEDPATLKHPTAISFRTFSDQTKSDRKALAACIQESRSKLSINDLKRIETEILVAVGTEDDIAGSLDDLIGLLPNARGFPIIGKNHMSAVGDKTFKAAVLEFLRQNNL